jgi:hypothetical protein
MSDDTMIIRTQLIGPNRCTALGVEAKGNAPVLDLCRKLLAAGHDPALVLEAYRSGTLWRWCSKLTAVAPFACVSDR